MFSAKVTLVRVFDLYSHDAFQLYVRSLSEVAEEQQNLARDKLDSFLKSEFPVGECPRILLSGVAATQITPGRTDSISSSCPQRWRLPQDAAWLHDSEGIERC
jgi:hypothetical protein